MGDVEDIQVTVKCTTCGTMLGVSIVRPTHKQGEHLACAVTVEPCPACMMREGENRVVAYHCTIASMLEDCVVIKRRTGW